MEKERVSASASGQKLLWIPFAEIVKPEMKARGTYSKGYPQGLVVHHTAGHQDKLGKSGVAYGREQGHLYLYMDMHGKIFQAFPLNKWGYHAGKSSYPGLGSGVSAKLVGLEVAAAGKLDRAGSGWKTYWGKPLPKEQVREIPKKNANQQPGAYQRYTAAQEASIIELCLWLKKNNPAVFNFDYVLGHDEVAPTRKNDPGGSLSMTMPALRELLKKRYATA